MISPWKEEEFFKRFAGRQALFEYARDHKIPLPVTPKAPWSIDANLIHVSYESGVLENPANSAPSGIYGMTVDPENAPNDPAFITIHFKNGIPCRLNTNDLGGTPKSVEGSLQIFKELNSLGSIHGIGRADIVENRFIGLKSRGLYETPGLSILREAHLDLEAMCIDREVRRLKSFLASKMADQVYNGLWFSPEFAFIRTCIDESQTNVTGQVSLKLYKGRAYVVNRKGEKSLYNEELVSMDLQGDFDPSHADGFIKVHSLRLKEHMRILNQK